MGGPDSLHCNTYKINQILLWKQVFLPSLINRRTGKQLNNLCLERAFPGDTHWLREGWNLESIDDPWDNEFNNNKFGSNVSLICKYYWASPNYWFFWPEMALTREKLTKQLHLSLRYKGLGNAMNYLKDHVI